MSAMKARRAARPYFASADHSDAPSASTIASNTAHPVCGSRKSAEPKTASAMIAVIARFMNIGCSSSRAEPCSARGDALDAPTCLHLLARAAETPLALLVRSDRGIELSGVEVGPQRVGE